MTMTLFIWNARISAAEIILPRIAGLLIAGVSLFDVFLVYKLPNGNLTVAFVAGVIYLWGFLTGLSILQGPRNSAGSLIE